MFGKDYLKFFCVANKRKCSLEKGKLFGVLVMGKQMKGNQKRGQDLRLETGSSCRALIGHGICVLAVTGT